jgi:hypothetical protein
MAGVLTGALFFIAIVTCITKDEIPHNQDYESDYNSSDEDDTPEFIVKRLMGKTT